MSVEHRTDVRHELHWEGVLVSPGGKIIDQCMVDNIATNGAKVTLKEVTDVPDRFFLVLSRNGGVRRHCELVWQTERSIGVRFIRIRARKRESFTHDALKRMLSPS